MTARDCAIKLMRRCGSNDPFVIARALDVILIYCTLVGLNGFYQYHKRNHIIYLSDTLDEIAVRFVLAHELGHMQMHRKLNTVFMDTKTLNLHSKFERQANTFAVELLLPDDVLREYPECTVYQLGGAAGVPEEFVDLKQIQFM
nr:MAG TPA: IrrE protein [Caudoviricetes sp.]